jgi:hypothetical protein
MSESMGEQMCEFCFGKRSDGGRGDNQPVSWEDLC